MGPPFERDLGEFQRVKIGLSQWTLHNCVRTDRRTPSVLDLFPEIRWRIRCRPQLHLQRKVSPHVSVRVELSRHISPDLVQRCRTLSSQVTSDALVLRGCAPRVNFVGIAAGSL